MKYIKKTLCLCLALMLCVVSCAGAATVNKTVLQKAIEIIGKMETNNNYASCSNDSNNCPSVGILQWNNARAVRLLRTVIQADKKTALGVLGETLYNKILNGSDTVFSGVKLGTEDRGAIARLLNTDAGRKAQDELAATDVSAYLEKAMELGIKDAKALIYYADIAHQAGTGAVKKYAEKAKSLAGSYADVTLDDMYNAALYYATYTKTRRTKVYNLLKETTITETVTQTTVKPTKVTLNKKGTVTMYVGDTLTLTATLSPTNAASTLTWKSSKAAVASIENGVLTANKKGTATVGVVTANGKKATVKVVVKNVPVASITLTGKTTMKKGETQQLCATVLPANAYNKKVTWKTSSSKIIAVKQDGTILAKKKGKATVGCVAQDGSKVLAKLVITVQ